MTAKELALLARLAKQAGCTAPELMRRALWTYQFARHPKVQAALLEAEDDVFDLAVPPVPSVFDREPQTACSV